MDDLQIIRQECVNLELTVFPLTTVSSSFEEKIKIEGSQEIERERENFGGKSHGDIDR